MINIKKIGFGFLNIITYIFLTQILTQIVSNNLIINNKILMNITLLIPPLIVLIILITINNNIFNNKITEFKSNKKEYIKLAFKYYMCGLLLMLISNLIINMFSTGLPINEEQNREIIKLLPLYSVINMTILAPLAEEITFRGSFKNSFNNKELYLIFTAFIFGFMHVIFNGDYINMLPYSALGYFLGKLYYETDNILLSFLMHFTHNTLCIILIFLGGVI